MKLTRRGVEAGQASQHVASEASCTFLAERLDQAGFVGGNLAPVIDRRWLDLAMILEAIGVLAPSHRLHCAKDAGGENGGACGRLGNLRAVPVECLHGLRNARENGV